MNEDFIRDYVLILKDKLISSSTEKIREDFDKGIEFAYYDALDILRTQLITFGFSPSSVGLDNIPFVSRTE